MIGDYEKDKLIIDMNELYKKINGVQPGLTILYFWNISTVQVLQIKLEELKKQHDKKINNK